MVSGVLSAIGTALITSILWCVAVRHKKKTTSSVLDENKTMSLVNNVVLSRAYSYETPVSCMRNIQNDVISRENIAYGVTTNYHQVEDHYDEVVCRK